MLFTPRPAVASARAPTVTGVKSPPPRIRLSSESAPRTTEIIAQLRLALESTEGEVLSHAVEYRPDPRYQRVESIRVLSGVQFGRTYVVVVQIAFAYLCDSRAIIGALRQGAKPSETTVPSGLNSVAWLTHHPFVAGDTFEIQASFKFLRMAPGWVLE